MRHADVPTRRGDASTGNVTRRAESRSGSRGRANGPDSRITRRATPAVGKRRAEVRRRQTVLKAFGVTMMVLTLVVGLGMVYFYRHFNGNLSVIDADGDRLGERPPKFLTEGPHEPLNILVMGSDSRDCAGCALDQHVGSGQRSDTTILVHLSANRKRAYAVSIPRDLMVDRPACKGADGSTSPAASYQMFNTAFSVGGPVCTLAQVEEMSGVRIDDFVVVDFTSFKSMVDAVGGVKVCIPHDVDDRSHGIFLEAGNREISGDDALAYVRVRHGIGDGSDLSRTKRQQAFIGAMVNTVLSSNTLANPVKVLKFLDAATNGITVSEGLGDLKKLASLGYGFKDIGLDRIQFITIPVGADPQDPNRLVLADDAQKVWDKIGKDKALGTELSEQSLRADSLPGAKKATQARDDGGAGGDSGETSDQTSDQTSGNASDKPKKPQSQLDEDSREYNGLCA